MACSRCMSCHPDTPAGRRRPPSSSSLRRAVTTFSTTSSGACGRPLRGHPRRRVPGGTRVARNPPLTAARPRHALPRACIPQQGMVKRRGGEGGGSTSGYARRGLDPAPSRGPADLRCPVKELAPGLSAVEGRKKLVPPMRTLHQFRLRYVGVRPIDSSPVDGPPSSAHSGRNSGGRTIQPALRAGRAIAHNLRSQLGATPPFRISRQSRFGYLYGNPGLWRLQVQSLLEPEQILSTGSR
jgi:hypothetical protein